MIFREKKRNSPKKTSSKYWALYFAVSILLLSGCLSKIPRSASTSAPQYFKDSYLNSLGYTIQIGAFAKVDNAARLTNSLENQGVNAYYFAHGSGLYKVRFGNFPTRKAARKVALDLKKSGTINEFYIVNPDNYPAAKQRLYGQQYLRESIAKTAGSFLGIPYKWGGSSPENGFDCSGLTMAVYQLNGLDLPRTSKEQFKTGVAVSKASLKKGDLVFFSTAGGRKVSHVGIYLGKNNFIHAPGKGKKIRVSTLNSRYFKKRYAGARTYLITRL